jgi:protein disulfide-isomerase
MRKILFLATLLFTLVVSAAAGPYDEGVDAQAALQQALAAARSDGHPVLVIFGANWCEDCRALDQAMKRGRNADQIAHTFDVVKIDVGNFNRNLALVREYGNPIQKGIPAAVVLSPENQVLYATRAGELADARTMGEAGVYDFFQGVVQAAKSK